jgi:hypothetical protein
MNTTPQIPNSEAAARIYMRAIASLVSALDDDDEGAASAIRNHPLRVSVRGGWYAPGSEPDPVPEEFCILLCAGGPAVRIVGTLDARGEPDAARMEHQDWFTGWIPLVATNEEEMALLAYCLHFTYV